MLNTITSGHFTILVALFGVAICASRAGRRVAMIIEAVARPLARRPAVVLCLLPVVSLAFNLCWAKYFGEPFPHVHDEFSYLLAADTFAHGRLTNPPHPMWKHFETLQVIQQPTYASKYPPSQGLAIALGQVIWNRPMMGVWLSSAAACAAIYWMLLGWAPRRWSLLGALLAVFHPELLFWSQGLWGGSIAFGAGALVVGALPRIFRAIRLRDVILMGTGIAILANARPFEGLMLVLGVLIALAVWGLVLRGGPPRELFVRRVMIPLSVMAVMTLGWIGYYNWRVTGTPLKMPYMLHEEQTSVTPVFLFQKVRPSPEYRFAEIRDEHLMWELETYQRAKAEPWAYAREKLALVVDKYQGQTGLALPLLLLPCVVLYDRRLRGAVLLLMVPIAGLLAATFMKSHYVAPDAGVMLVLVIGSMRHLNVWQRRRRTGQLLVCSVVLLTAVGYADRYREVANPERVLPGEPLGAQRERIVRQLSDMGGKHLVLVSYDVPHDVLPEWVYNAADVDQSNIVWAHDMGPADNQELLDYFKGRSVWRVLVSERPAELVPWTASAQTRPSSRPTSQPSLQSAGDLGGER